MDKHLPEFAFGAITALGLQSDLGMVSLLMVRSRNGESFTFTVGYAGQYDPRAAGA